MVPPRLAEVVAGVEVWSEVAHCARGKAVTEPVGGLDSVHGPEQPGREARNRADPALRIVQQQHALTRTTKVEEAVISVFEASLGP